MGEGLVDHGRSLAETPTWSVATVTTVMVFVCLLVERSIYRFGKWLKKTKRKALYASLEKIKEELMLLGLISLMLGQWARWISKICVDSSLFNSRFYLCSEEDIGVHKHLLLEEYLPHSNNSVIPPKGLTGSFHHYCGLGKEPFVSLEGLEQLHKFLFVLGITYVFYSCLAVGLAMTKIYSWRKWENEACILAIAGNQHGTVTNRLMRRQTTFAIHHASHPWSRNKILVWMLCFLRQFKSSIRKSDYLALRLGFLTNHRLHLSYNFHKYMVRSMEDKFHAIVGISWPLWGYAILCIIINIHGLNIYFYLSFIPVILVMLVGTKLQHVVSKLALEVANTSASGPPAGIQVKPRDELFWFGKPGILLKLIQFISFQNAFEMATFIWSLWGFKQRSCFMNNHGMIVVRLASGLIVQFWCSYSTVPLTVIITQMGSKCKKALVAESVRESLHSWCKRVKEKSKHSHAARSVCSIDEAEETTTVASLTLSPCSSVASLNEIVAVEEANSGLHTDDQSRVENRGGEIVGLERISSGARRHHGIDNDHLSFRLSEYISQSAKNSFIHHEDMDRGDGNHMEEDIDRIDVVEGGDFRDGIVDEDVELGGDCDRIEEEEEEPKFETLFDFLERTPRDL